MGARLVRLVLLPLALYLTTFLAATYPLVRRFRTHLFGNEIDGLANLWGIWWVEKALTEFRRLPLHTDYLHYPHGITLLPQVMALPFNGLLLFPFRSWLTLEEAYNAALVFAFAVGGLTTFWLCHHFTRAYFPSLVGGMIFTFSNYHFAHADGHLNLVSLEWIPLFLLLAFRALERPTVLRGVFAGLALALVTSCDLYYFLYCSLTLAVIVIVRLTRPAPERLTRAHLRALWGFAAICAVTVVPVFAGIWWMSRRDPFLGGHAPGEFSLDLLAPFIPGGHWRFARWTQAYWSRLPGNIDESSVHVGLAVLVLAACAVRWRHKLERGREISLWVVIAAFFAVLSLGPALQIWGRTMTREWLPYVWLTSAVPPLQMTGMPVRMIVMTQLALAVLAAWGLAALAARPKGQLATALLLAVAAFEYAPRPIPTTQLPTPAYVSFVAGLPERAALLDGYSNFAHALLWQTRHQKRMGFGYVSRTPKSVSHLDGLIAKAAWAGRWDEVCGRFGITHALAPIEGAAPPPRVRSLLLPPETSQPAPGRRIVFDDGNMRVMALDCPMR
jgi:hypothetical protein